MSPVLIKYGSRDGCASGKYMPDASHEKPNWMVDETGGPCTNTDIW